MQQGNFINTLNAQLNPICHLLALLGAHYILHVSRIRVNVFWSCESHGTIRTVHTTYAAAVKTTTHPKTVQKTICCNSTSNAPDDGRTYPKHVELRIH